MKTKVSINCSFLKENTITRIFKYFVLAITFMFAGFIAQSEAVSAASIGNATTTPWWGAYDGSGTNYHPDQYFSASGSTINQNKVFRNWSSPYTVYEIANVPITKDSSDKRIDKITLTTASGTSPAIRHLISRNFSAPRSAPKPASVTA